MPDEGFGRPVVSCCLTLIIGFGAVASSSGQQRAASASSGFAITAIRAMPYYPETGTIRRTTDLFDPRLALRNVPIGSASEPDPIHRSTIEDWDIPFGTTATYVEIDVSWSGEGDRLLSAPALEFLAQAGRRGRVLERRRVELAPLLTGPGKIWHIPVLVYGTGCEPVNLRASLIRGTTAFTSQSRTIPFACRE
jgi:hypothetical protein